jgi:hypothetical protein
MPGPQSSVPQSVKPSLPKQRFTLEQANKALPLVERIVKDVVTTYAQMESANAELEAAAPAARRALEPQLRAARERLEMLVEELANIGVELKDPRLGLIDFVGRHQGHDVYLCWKLGEERIAFFHELQTGFAGRQPVTALEET